MLVSDGHPVGSDIEALFPDQPEPLLPKGAADVLESNLISAFETAVEQGMRPADALAAVLCWVSSEMVRTGPDKSGGPCG